MGIVAQRVARSKLEVGEPRLVFDVAGLGSFGRRGRQGSFGRRGRQAALVAAAGWAALDRAWFM